jgi:uncharacterized Zn finger protein (UPF0148 family)
MISLGKLVGLKPLHEAEEDKYTHIGYGKYKEKGKEKDDKAPTFKKDGEKFVPVSPHAAAAQDADAKDTKKVNIFNKDKEEPKSEPKKSSSYSGNTEDMKIDMQHAFEDGYTGKGLKGVKKTKDGFQVNMASYMSDSSFKGVLDSFNKTNGTNFVAGKIEKTTGGTRVSISEPAKEEPKSEPSQPKRQGDPQVNKATLSKAKKLGITPQKLGKEEYSKKMSQAAVAALTDANFHSEARELIAKLEGKPEWAEDPRKSAPDISSPEYDEWNKNSVYSSEYYDADDDTEDLGISAANEAGWDGIKAADSIAFTLRMNGFHKLADTIQSVVKENKSTRLKDLV